MGKMYTEISGCRICGNRKLLDILSLGEQPQAGIFPLPHEGVDLGPLELVKCDESVPQSCGLVQLRHSFHQSAMFGEHYGYRSSLNRSMMNHLSRKVEDALRFAKPQAGDAILDIGSNDGSTLGFYPADKFRLIGIDPTIKKFAPLYRPDIEKHAEFFSGDLVHQILQGKKAQIITSISMFYDLENPLDFVQGIKESLAPNGIWVFEQSYMPTMLERVAYDTICHEHLEYYHLKPILWMLERCGLRIVDLELNEINGGSFSLTVSHQESAYPDVTHKLISPLLEKEKALKLESMAPYSKFRESIELHKEKLVSKLNELKNQGKTIFGYGASTKGNVVLNYCGIHSNLVSCIAEVNEDKVGHVTPGSRIPIISESEARSKRPDVFLVLPWHFRPFFLEKEAPFLREGGRLLFPLPEVEEIQAPK